MPPFSSSRSRHPASVPAAEVPTMRALTSVISGVVVVCALYFGRTVFIPIILAILLSFLVAPFVGVLRRLRIGNLPSVLVAMLLTLSALAAIGVVLGLQIVQLTSDLPHYQREFERKVRVLDRQTMGKANAILNRASIDLNRITPNRDLRARAAVSEAPVPVEVRPQSATPMTLAKRVFTLAIGPLQEMAIVLVVATFILLQREDLRDRLIRLLGSRDLHRTTTAMDEAARRLSRYFLAQLGVNLTVGIIISGGLILIGLPGALLFGVLATLLRFVPYIGTWIAALLAVAFAAVIGPSWSMLIWTVVLFVSVEMIGSQLIEPLVYGRSTGLSPFAVIVAAIFWSSIWGPVGLVLSTPLTLCLVILGRHVERLEFLEVIFGDRPALTPAESFYQRLLANDPDELLAQAESLLKVRRLSTYYDEVALAGLRLANNDLLRGVVTETQMKHINESAQYIVEGLEETADLVQSPGDEPALHTGFGPDNDDVNRHPAPIFFDAGQAGHRAAVLCITGRGKLDNLAGLIVAQLLRKHGLSAVLQPFERFSRTQMKDSDLAGVSILCIVSFDTLDTAPYLRTLERRLRAAAPQAAVIFGVGDPLPSMTLPVALTMNDEPLVPEVKDESTASCFAELVNQCVLAARQQNGDSFPWTDPLENATAAADDVAGDGADTALSDANGESGSESDGKDPAVDKKNASPRALPPAMGGTGHVHPA